MNNVMLETYPVHVFWFVGEYNAFNIIGKCEIIVYMESMAQTIVKLLVTIICPFDERFLFIYICNKYYWTVQFVIITGKIMHLLLPGFIH